MHLPGVDDDMLDGGLTVNQGLQQIGMLFDPHKYRSERESGGEMDGMALAALLQQRGGGGGGFGGMGGGGRLMGAIKRSFEPGFDHEVLFGPNVAGHSGHLHLSAPRGLRRIGRILERKGFDVGEHPAFGGVDPVHTSGSHHYRGDALDINYGGGGRWDTEQEALRWLKRRLRRIYGNEAYYG